MIQCDALVAGAGPAGAIAALELARAGFHVVIADACKAVSRKIGESLPGVALRLIRSLGIDESDFGSVHQKIGGNLACWSSETLEATDFFCTPDGPGWRLSRGRFDTCLLNAALSSGARHLPSNVDGLVRDGETWQAHTSQDIVVSRWLVDATGRRSFIARALGVPRARDTGLAALYSFGSPDGAGMLDRTLIEAAPEGWWYGARLPDGMAVLALHVDPQDARRARMDWLPALDRTLFMREFFPPTQFADGPSVTDAGGSHLQTLSGDHWVACGDAAMAFDPLSSQGIYTAMYSGRAAARAILDREGGDPEAFADYAQGIGAVREAYRVRLAASYRSVRRWEAAPFWFTR